DLRTTLAAMQWVINAYTLCMSALLLVGGAAADRFGRRLIFVIGVSIFAAASLGCGLAANAEVLIAARVVQGVGAALLIPCSLALIGAAFEGVASLVYGLIAASDLGWSDAAVVGSVTAAALLLGGFVLAEGRSRSPMMPLELFRSRVFSGVNLLTLLLYGALGGAFFFYPFLLIQARGYSAAAAGAAYLPFTLVMGVLARWGGGLVDRFGARWPLIVGPALTALGFVLLGSGAGPLSAIVLPMSVLALGMAITVAPLTTTVMNAVPAHRSAGASARSSRTHSARRCARCCGSRPRSRSLQPCRPP